MTRLFGIIGSPITHSLSPAMHTAAFRALQLDAAYTPLNVSLASMEPMLRAFILAGVEGLNVTVPLKEAVMPLLDDIDPSAKAIGAVNTIVIRRRKTVGYNTDGIGFVRAVTELGWRSKPVRAVVLGAGGAARAVAWELARLRGSDVTIANRNLRRAERLAHWLARAQRRCRVHVVPLRKVRLERATLLVNATTVGMRASDDLLIDPSSLRRGLAVYDLVYHRETPLVDAARRRGCVAANGLSMLLYQGGESFRLWFRRSPPLQVMRQALQKELHAQHASR